MKYLICLLVFLMFPGMVLAGDSPEGPPPAKVIMGAVQIRLVSDNTPIVGTLYFEKVSKVSTEVSGLVQAIPFHAGDRVKKGDLLVRLNTDFLEKDIDLALTRIEQVDIQIEKASKDLQRYEALYRENAATEKVYDDLRFSRRNLRKERKALDHTLEINRLKKAKSAIYAPFDGIVLEKCAEVGDWVAPGALFCRLGALDALCVKVPVAEELMMYSKPGEQIQVTLPAFRKSINGTVSGYLPEADLKTKNVMVKIRLPRIPGVVENLSATVQVPTGPPRKLALVPRRALVNLKGGDFVYTVKEGKAVPLPVRISAFVGEFAGIEGPAVTAGMSVIVDGGERLRPEQPVQIIKEN